MTFDELRSLFEGIPCDERRENEKDYLEVVVARKDMPAASEALASFFGPPFKPEGVRPSREAGKAADPYGGIRDNQTLYLLRDGKIEAVALLWPWSGGDLITIKVILESGSGGEG